MDRNHREPPPFQLNAQDKESMRGMAVNDTTLRGYYEALASYQKMERELGATPAERAGGHLGREDAALNKAVGQIEKGHAAGQGLNQQEIGAAYGQAERSVQSLERRFTDTRDNLTVMGEVIRNGEYTGKNPDLYAKAARDTAQTDAYIDRNYYQGAAAGPGNELPSLSRAEQNQLSRGVAAEAVAANAVGQQRETAGFDRSR